MEELGLGHRDRCSNARTFVARPMAVEGCDLALGRW